MQATDMQLLAEVEKLVDKGHLVWPESMFPFLFDRELDREYAKGHPWALRGSYAGRLLIGVLAHPFGEAYIYNSAALIAADGELRGLYDKNALLVLGEYIPFRDELPAWAARMRAKLPDWPDIEPGDGPVVLEDGDLRVLPLSCYEDILPGYVLDAVRAGDPNLLVTLANHAWFGDSVAPRQAMALATFRGSEGRRDLARSTNTGGQLGDRRARARRGRGIALRRAARSAARARGLRRGRAAARGVRGRAAPRGPVPLRGRVRADRARLEAAAEARGVSGKANKARRAGRGKDKAQQQPGTGSGKPTKGERYPMPVRGVAR